MGARVSKRAPFYHATNKGEEEMMYTNKTMSDSARNATVESTDDAIKRGIKVQTCRTKKVDGRQIVDESEVQNFLKKLRGRKGK